MRVIALLAPILIALGVISSLQAEEKEIIKDKSPDGEFALRIEGWDTEIIETATKKKVIDLENLAGHDATLIWSGDSQRVAYFNESRGLQATTVYFRQGSTFIETPLPDFPRCDEVKDKDPNALKTIFYTVRPKIWQDSGALFLSIRGEWETSTGGNVYCEQSLIIAFDAQHQASVQKAEKKQNPVGRKIESPNGTFFVEELNAPAKDDEGHPRMDQEVWIVSAKDPATRERLPGFYEEEGSGGLNSATISPDENWIVINRVYGSHLSSTYLMHRTEGLSFEDAFPKAGWPGQEYPSHRFDNAVWKFFSQTENIPTKKINANELGPTAISVVAWSEDSGRLLFELHGGLAGERYISERDEEREKPGIDGWFAYYNTKTHKFELTDKLRKINKDARKRWTGSGDVESGFLPPPSESVGHKGPDAPVAERLEKYQAALTAIEERREKELEEVDRTEFEKNEKEWRAQLNQQIAQLKDGAAKLELRARSTSERVDELRASWRPVYEEAKTGEAKPSPP